MMPPAFLKNYTNLSGNTVPDLLEADVIMTLANRFHPLLMSCGGDAIPPPAAAEDDAMNSVAATYLNESSEEPRSNKRAYTPELADETSDESLQDDLQAEDDESYSPPPTPKRQRRPSKKARKSSNSSSTCALPSNSDPVDESFVMSLYSDADLGRLNAVHAVVRRDVLEARRTSSGKVFFQCGCCKHLPRSDRAKLSTVAPQELTTLYRSFVRFMMTHVKNCKHIPQEIKDMDAKVSRDGRANGVKAYWLESLIEQGFRDGEDGMSIVYCPTADY